MEDLTTYLHALNYDEETMKLEIGQALKGPAREWWYYVESSVFALDDFRGRFMEKYWNPREPDKVHRALEFGSYAAERNLSRAEYATKLYNQVIELPDNYPPGLIVEKMSSHFDDTIQQDMLIKDCVCFDDFLALLEKLDSAKILNSSLEGAKYVDFRGEGQYSRSQGQPRPYDARFSRGGQSNNQRSYGKPRRADTSGDLLKTPPQPTAGQGRNPHRASTPYPETNRSTSVNQNANTLPRQLLTRDRPYNDREAGPPRNQTFRTEDRRRSINKIDIEDVNDGDVSERPGNESPLH
ncbi:hypothetical protein QAD02_002769 [Eretmocerus hayati]|uniref:Uncharacterized protein n=1 Tax=Eretmocerus hayati TaxID=131215 RepID=A0ACC2NJZ3_9HYME|nr:hypothetical protein QAD02_002769 [Eretmocerus hayati]